MFFCGKERESERVKTIVNVCMRVPVFVKERDRERRSEKL
jgi:hypothetical protein